MCLAHRTLMGGLQQYNQIQNWPKGVALSLWYRSCLKLLLTPDHATLLLFYSACPLGLLLYNTIDLNSRNWFLTVLEAVEFQDQCVSMVMPWCQHRQVLVRISSLLADRNLLPVCSVCSNDPLLVLGWVGVSRLSDVCYKNTNPVRLGSHNYDLI